MKEHIAAGIEIQERDLDILFGLFECRLMSLRHITDLYFDGKAEAAKKRIQRLKASGLVRERPRKIGEPSVLHLSIRAFTPLSSSGRLGEFPLVTKKSFEKRAQVSEMTLRHELEVMDVRVAICRAIEGHPALSLAEFSTWPLLYQFTARSNRGIAGRKEILMKPDGFIRIRAKEETETFEDMFFLEVDRSSEKQEIIGEKAACYLDYYQRGGMALRFGGKREDFRDFPFRVLMVFKNEERRNNAAERLLLNVPPVLTQTWLTTFAEVLAAPLGEIWIQPKDYLEATRGTRFDPAAQKDGGWYRRQIERERSVERLISKKSLIGE